ncbi:MAG: tRNA 2-thiouridine(34) synthase MnmA [Sporomusaceae bacterium]|nr:tRNA 2-thiouridine(34) synthase MnmA [Sporomusaceae bacterium]
MKPKTKVVVAMSGGVDSSLTAALLAHQGYDVVGVTMKLWEQKKAEGGGNPPSAVDDARSVAAGLDIPFQVLDFTAEFQDLVIDYFCREYARGRTPNPCVVCNKHLKFGKLFAAALALGADHVATGHYARIVSDPVRKRHLLLKGLDTAKDQSYVLYNLKKDALSRLILPLGAYTKQETREIAKKMGLKVADKPDSQEICFIPDNDYKAFLKEQASTVFKKGKIVDTAGKVWGEHEGIEFFTVGQRKGLGGTFGKPVYVVAINAAKNEVVIGDSADIFAAACLVENLNFISIDELSEPLPVEVKIRYAAAPAPAVIVPLADGKVKVEFQKPQRAVTPGQSAVFYHGEEVVGGGVIVEAIR